MNDLIFHSSNKVCIEKNVVCTSSNALALYGAFPLIALRQTCHADLQYPLNHAGTCLRWSTTRARAKQIQASLKRTEWRISYRSQHDNPLFISSCLQRISKRKVFKNDSIFVSSHYFFSLNECLWFEVKFLSCLFLPHLLYWFIMFALVVGVMLICWKPNISWYCYFKINLF